MTIPLPIQIAATGFEMVVYLLVGIVWLIFQGLAHAAKKNAPPQQSTPEGEQPEPPFGGEWGDLIETLTGQKSARDSKEAAPVLPRHTTAPKRAPVQLTRATRTAPPPIPAPAEEAIEPAPASTTHWHIPQPQRHVAPLMRMKWPRSALSNLSVTAATRANHTSPLRQRMLGPAGLRNAMISRIVLDSPGGR